MWSVLNNFILTATSKPKPVHPQQDIQRCKNKCWKFRVLRAHFWPCHVSWKAATGCRTCARPGKRIGPVLSSSPSVWTSECRSAWCTYTSPLQESTRRHFIYQEPSHDIVIFCCQVFSVLHVKCSMLKPKLVLFSCLFISYILLLQMYLFAETICDVWYTAVFVLGLCAGKHYDNTKGIPEAAETSRGLPSSTCLWDYRLRHTRI